MSALHVGTCYFDADGIAQLVLAMMAAAHKLAVLFVELIIVAVQIVHAYEAFAVVLVNLAVDAIGLDAADVCRLPKIY